MRTRRWSQVVHGFRAGVLSPASQDIIDNDNWLAGAAKLENFNVERDGGVSGRPALIRGIGPNLLLPKPRFGLLAGMPWTVAGATATMDGDPTTGGTIPDTLYDRTRGIAPLPLRFNITSVAQAADIFKVDLAGGLPRSMAFYGVRVDEGYWSRFVNEKRRLTFEVVGIKRSDQSEVHFAPDTDPSEDEDPFTSGTFCPGQIARDIVVRFDTAIAGEPSDLESVVLRVKDRGAGVPIHMAITGISCFSDEPAPAGAPRSVELHPDTFDAPWRIIPWVIRDVPFVLVIGMDWVSLLQVYDDSRAPERPRVEEAVVPARPPVYRQGDNAESRAIWHFTERQLREMTWSTFGGNLLLLHHDFPHPLEVRLPKGAIPFSIKPLGLRNLPQISTNTIDRISPFVSETGDTSFVEPGDTVRPQKVVRVVAVAGAEAIGVGWSGTGATSYRIGWDTKAVHDAAIAANGAWEPGNTFLEQVADVRQYTINDDSPGPDLVAGTEYAIAVRSVIGASSSTWSDVIYATPLAQQLTAPIVPVPTHGTTDGAIVLDWPDVARADGYDVQYRIAGATPENAWLDVSVQPNASTYTFTGAVSNDDGIYTTYDFRVRSTDSTGIAAASDWSNIVTLRAEKIAPAAPTGLALAAGSADGGIVATWSEGAGQAPESYRIRWRVKGLTSWDSEATTLRAVRTYTFTGTAGQTYEVQVRAERVNSDPSAYTATVERAAGNVPAPAPSSFTLGAGDADGENRVSGYSAPATEAHTVRIQWKSGAEAFATARQADVALAANEALAYDHAATAGTSYDYQMAVQRPHAAFSPFSAPMTRIAQNLSPGQVGGLTAADGDVDGEIDVSWSAVAGARGYVFEHRPSSRSSWDAEPEQAGTSFEFTGTAGTGYAFRVKAVRVHAADGGWSEEATFTAQNEAAAAPTITTADGTVDGAIVVTATGATGTLVVQYKSGMEAYSDSREEEVSGSTLTLSLVRGTSYTIRARIDRANAPEGAWSGDVSATGAEVAADAPSVSVTASTTVEGRVSVRVSGGHETGATYTLQWKSGSQAFSSSANPARHITTQRTASGGVTLTLSGLTVGTTYSFRARITRAGGTHSDWSSTLTATPGVVSLARLTSVTLASRNADAGLRATWAAIPNAEGYGIRIRSKVGAEAFPVWSTRTSFDVPLASRTGYDLPDTVAGRTYEIQVRAYRGTGASRIEAQGLKSNQLEARNLTPGVPGTPSVADGTADGRMVVSWTAGTNADSYDLQHRIGTGDWTTVTQTGTSFTLNGTAGTIYEFRVKSTRSHAPDSAWSASKTYKARNLAAPKPVITAQASTTVSRRINVESTAAVPSGGGTLRLQHRTGSQSFSSARQFDGTMMVVNPQLTGIGVTNLVSGTTYYFRARIIRANADPSPWSDEVSAVAADIVPTTPASFSARVVDGDFGLRKVDRLTWTAATRGTSYQIQSNRFVGWISVNFYTVGGTSITSTGGYELGTSGETVRFRIRSTDAPVGTNTISVNSVFSNYLVSAWRTITVTF